MLGAVGHGPAAMGAGLLEDTRLEEGGHGRLAVRAFHGFDIPVGDETAFARGSRLRRVFNPDGFAFVTGDGVRADGCASGLTGGHEGGESETAGEDEEANFEFHGVRFSMMYCLFLESDHHDRKVWQNIRFKEGLDVVRERIRRECGEPLVRARPCRWKGGVLFFLMHRRQSANIS